MAIVLADVLEPEQVVLELKGQSRDAALREIVATMRGDAGLREPEKFLAEVRAREDVHTTFMGNGIAFPHARTSLLEKIILGIGRSRAGVPFGESGELAYLIFLVGVPQRMINDYLVCVGGLARLTRDDAKREALMNAATAGELVELLRSGSLLLE